MDTLFDLTLDFYSRANLNFAKFAGPDSAVGRISRLAFGSSQVRFPGPAPFTSCQLLVKVYALSAG